MTAYLLDTNHLSPLVTLGHPLREQVLSHRLAGDTFALNAAILNEFLFGIATLPRARANLLEWNSLKVGFFCYSVDADDAHHAFELRLVLRQRGRQLELVDSLIAAIALRYRLALLTTDGDFKMIPSLRTENWLTQ